MTVLTMRRRRSSTPRAKVSPRSSVSASGERATPPWRSFWDRTLAEAGHRGGPREGAVGRECRGQSLPKSERVSRNLWKIRQSMLRRGNRGFSLPGYSRSPGNGGSATWTASAGNVIIVKRKTVVEGGHHGGAWKVAYADFVTAMMAFFLLMWLLSDHRPGDAARPRRLFQPDDPDPARAAAAATARSTATRCSARTCSPQDETGQKGDPEKMDVPGTPDESLFEVEQELLGGSGDAMEADPLLAHIRTRVTDEGLIIEVFDIAGSPLFDGADRRARADLRGSGADDRPRPVAHGQPGGGDRAPRDRRRRPRTGPTPGGSPRTGRSWRGSSSRRPASPTRGSRASPASPTAAPSPTTRATAQPPGRDHAAAPLRALRPGAIAALAAS